jgi:hypothetical protein
MPVFSPWHVQSFAHPTRMKTHRENHGQVVHLCRAFLGLRRVRQEGLDGDAETHALECL